MQHAPTKQGLLSILYIGPNISRSRECIHFVFYKLPCYSCTLFQHVTNAWKIFGTEICVCLNHPRASSFTSLSVPVCRWSHGKCFLGQTWQDSCGFSTPSCHYLHCHVGVISYFINSIVPAWVESPSYEAESAPELVILKCCCYQV